MSPGPETPTWQRRLTVAAARQRVCARELERAIYQAATQGGLSQREISELVGIHSQPTVQRNLRRFSEDPSLLDQTPADVIDQRTAEVIDRDEMMYRLLNWKYSFGAVVHVAGVATDAYGRSSWDDIEAAFYRGLLDDEEFQQLAEQHLNGA